MMRIGNVVIRTGFNTLQIFHDVTSGTDSSWMTDWIIPVRVVDELHEVEIFFDTASQQVLSATLDGVSLVLAGVQVTRPFSFSGLFRIGDSNGLFGGWSGIVANVELEDTGTPSNTFSWAVDEASANTEASQVNVRALTYVNIAAGLPVRELFTFNVGLNQWDGNNGTTLTLPVVPTTADITEVGPSFTESINVTLSTALIEAAITELGPSFTESIELSLTAKLNAAITEAGPSFTESINATVLAQGVFVNISESGPSFTESVIAEISKNVIATITEQGPSFSESIVTNILKDIAASITENGPSFTESIVAKTPTKWIDKPDVDTTWGNKAKVSTTWTDIT